MRRSGSAARRARSIGNTGPTGAAGPTGPQGATGPQGPGANPDGVTLDNGGAGGTLEVAPLGITGAQLAKNAILLTSNKVTGILPIASGGTGQNAAKPAREAGLGAGGYYTNFAIHAAGTVISIPQTSHLLRSSRSIFVQVQDNTTGNVELPDISVAEQGTWRSVRSLRSLRLKMVTLVG